MFYEDKSVLVSGGSGFLGIHLVQELLNRGAKVRVPIHSRSMPLYDERVEIVQADLSNRSECLDVVGGVDYVFHAAGAVGSAAVSKIGAMAGIAVNLNLSSEMLHAAWLEGVERFLLVSSSTVYPPASYPIKEHEAWNAAPYPSYVGYGWMKRYLEKLAEYVASESQMKIAIVRPTAVYGRWDNFDPTSSHVIPSLIKKAVDRQDPYGVWGSGTEIRDFLHISDLARGCIMALETYPECDPINLGYGKTVTIREIVETILGVSGYNPHRIQFQPDRPSTASVRVVDTTKARRILGFEPQISLEEGLRDTLEWYRQQSEIRG